MDPVRHESRELSAQDLEGKDVGFRLSIWDPIYEVEHARQTQLVSLLIGLKLEEYGARPQVLEKHVNGNRRRRHRNTVGNF